MTVWNRADAAASVADRLWLYLHAGADRAEMQAVVEDLWRLPRGDLRRVTAAHLGLHPLTGQMLQAAGRALRELPSSVTSSRVELQGMVRGPTDWTRSRVRQWQTGDPTRFICHPPERRYDTALGRLLRLALETCLRVLDAADLPARSSTGLTRQLQDRRDLALHLSRNAKLSEVTAVRSLPQATLRGLSRHRHAAPILEFVRLAREAVDELEPAQVRHVLAAAALLPTTDDRLFELMVGFAILDRLRQQGRSVALRLLPHEHGPVAVIQGEPPLHLYWQRAVQRVPGLPSGSRYRDALGAAGLRESPLRPDFVLVTPRLDRILLVEVKHTTRTNADADRDGLLDALAYLYDAQSAFAGKPHPHALVVAWNSHARPAPDTEVMVSGYETIGAALDLALTTWRQPHSSPSPLRGPVGPAPQANP